MHQKFNVKAVIFDRDGVIIDTEGIAINSIKSAFKELGYEVTNEDIAYLSGRNFDTYKHHFLEKWDFNPDDFRKIQKELFNKNLNDAKIFESTIELIKSLHLKNIPIGLATSAGLETTNAILDSAKIRAMFKVITTREDCEKFKPDPEPYLITSMKLNIDPKFCVVIEDSELGVKSAKSAGMFCIAIPTKYTKDQDFSLADVVLESSAEVLDLLNFV